MPVANVFDDRIRVGDMKRIILEDVQGARVCGNKPEWSVVLGASPIGKVDDGDRHKLTLEVESGDNAPVPFRASDVDDVHVPMLARNGFYHRQKGGNPAGAKTGANRVAIVVVGDGV